jgi:AcrR family transcriptional regulator
MLPLDMDEFMRELEVTIRRGWGFKKERVENMDFAKLESEIALEVTMDTDANEAHLRLLKAVGETLAEAGLYDSSVEMFAKKSGLSKSSLYSHFENRAQMIGELFSREFERIVKVALNNRAKSDVPEEQVYLVLFSIAQYLQRHSMILRALDKLKTRRHGFQYKKIDGKDHVVSLSREIFAGITALTENGERNLSELDTNLMLFTLVNTLMYRPAELDMNSKENHSCRVLFRFLTLGLEN